MLAVIFMLFLVGFIVLDIECEKVSDVVKLACEPVGKIGKEF